MEGALGFEERFSDRQKILAEENRRRIEADFGEVFIRKDSVTPMFMWSPLQAYFDGITSVVGRYLVIILVLLGGFATSAPWQKLGLNFFYLWCVASFVMPIEWASYLEGFGCLLGFAFIALFIFFATLFLFDWGCKSGASIFGMYTSATIYFLPLSDDSRRGMLWAAFYYTSVCICLWGLPWLRKR